MIWPLLGSSEASLGLLRSASWAAQKAPKTLKNVVFELPDGSGRAAALPRPRRVVFGAENHPNYGMISSHGWDDLGQIILTSQLPGNHVKWEVSPRFRGV